MINLTRREFLYTTTAFLLGCATRPIAQVEQTLELPELYERGAIPYDPAQEEKERELVKLARKSFVEKNFLYVHDDQELIDVGKREDLRIVYPDWDKVLEYQGKKLTKYHLHTLIAIWLTLRNTFHRDDEEVSDEKLFEFLRNSYRAYPGETDVFRESSAVFLDYYRKIEPVKGIVSKVVDHKGVIEYSGLQDFVLSRIKGANDTYPYGNLLYGYQLARACMHTFLDASFMHDLMDALPEEARLKTTEEDFDMSYEEFSKLLGEFNKLEIYVPDAESDEIARKSVLVRKEGKEKAKKTLKDFLFLHVSALSEPSAAWESGNTPQKQR